MRRIATVVALLALVAGTATCQVNQEMIDKVTAGELTEAKASWWGFNEEDATEALQAAINSGVPKLVVENMGKPWIVTPIMLVSDQEIVFEEGCEILARRGEFKGTNDSLFSAKDVQNVTLRGEGEGATFRMWQEDYDNPDLYSKAEWRHCLQLRGASDINVSGLTLRDSGGDGIYLGIGSGGTTNLNVHIKDVICDNNYRQGISVITAENLLIEDTIMRNTSGTAPQAGIDFEPNNPGERLVNVVMRNCLTENNNASGYMWYLRPLNAESEPISIRLENCRSLNDGSISARVITDGTLDDSVTGTIEFVDCTFEGSNQPGISISKPADRGLVSFERCWVLDCGGDALTTSPIIFVSRAGADVPVGGVHFEDVVVRDLPDRDPMAYTDMAGGIALADITGNLFLEDAEGERTRVDLTPEVLAEWMPVVSVKDIPRLPLDKAQLVPLVLDSPAVAVGVRWPIIRKVGTYLLYANEGDDVSFTVNHMQVGNYSGEDMPIEIVAPSGEVAHEAAAPFQQETVVSFAAPETGVYTIALKAGGNRFQLKDPSHPLNVSAADSSINFIGQEKDLSFYVPEGTTEFGVRVIGQGTGEAVKATLLTPTGEVFEEVDNQFQLHQFEVELDEPGQGEIWTLQIRKPSAMTWEDYFVELRGIPAVLAPAGATLLVPAK